MGQFKEVHSCPLCLLRWKAPSYIEQFLLQKLFGKGCTVHRYKWLLCPRRVFVDGLCEELLARTCLTEKQDSTWNVAESLCLLHQAHHVGILSYDIGEAVASHQALAVQFGSDLVLGLPDSLSILKRVEKPKGLLINLIGWCVTKNC